MGRKAADTRGNVRIARKFMYARLLLIFVMVLAAFIEIGRASCRERVCQYV